ncbi:MAG: glycosyltransferase [Bacteroidetes bacterium]|nr:glycosyltransferase [Bacteroidota bacterium]
MIVFVFCVAILSVFISIQIFSLVFLFINKNKAEKKFVTPPMVSILLAARNEEKTVERCLESFSKIDYPSDKIEFLIGNDASEDKTEEIVLKFIEYRPNFKLYNINEKLGKSAGKANVLAHLANAAKGEFYFITDCDVAVNSQWVKTILKSFTDDVGIVSGTTTCKTGGFFENLQTLDWLHFMGYIKSFANASISCTSVGNNMAVRATAYWQTGGYEKIDFSITEDYKLFWEITRHGWQWRNILNPESLGLATYISNFTELLHQRKRWLIGAKELPINWKIVIVIFGLYIPAIIVLAYINIKLAIFFCIIKFIIQTAYIFSLIKLTKLRFNKGIHYFFIYEIYLHFTTLATAIFYFLPIKSIWKGRKYSSKGLN